MADILSEDEWFDRLLTAAKKGQPVDLVPDGSVRATFTNPAHADLWSDDRIIPANAIRRVLTLPESEVKAFDPGGLRIRGARIDGEASWNRVVFSRQLAFVGCAFESVVKVIDSRISTLSFPSCELPGLFMDAAIVAGGVVAQRVTVRGEVRAAGAQIAGQFNLTDANLVNPSGHALVLDSARISLGLFAENLSVNGAARAVGAHIGDQVNFRGADFSTPSAPALVLDSARVDGSIFADGLTVLGETCVAGVHISDELNLNDAVLTNPSGPALVLDGTRVGSDLSAARMTAYGEVRGIGARIGGELNLSDATFTKPLLTDPDADAIALNLNGARIDRDLLGIRMTTEGEIRAIGADVSGRLDLSEATLTNRTGDALTLESASVTHLLLRPTKLSGNIHLDLARIQILQLPPAHENQVDLRGEEFADSTLSAAGWSVADLRGAIRRDWSIAREFLSHTPPSTTAATPNPEPSTTAATPNPEPSTSAATSIPEFIPQPWLELADTYDRIGHPDHSRKLRVHTEKQITKNTRGVTKASRRIYGATVGYGYQPFFPALWLLGVLVVAGLLIWTNQTHFLNVNNPPTTANDPCTNDSTYPCFNTIGYTLQNVVPAASGPMRPDWVLSTNGWWPLTLGVLLALLRLAAWGFAALTLAAMTGLLRRR